LEFETASGVFANEFDGYPIPVLRFGQDLSARECAGSENMERANMAHSPTNFRKSITRGLALMVMLFMYGFSLIGTSAVVLGVSSAPAQARGGRGGGFGGGFRGGGFRGGGFRGGGFRGAGIGLGLGLGLAASPYYYGGYGGNPYGYGGYYGYGDGDGCYVARRIWTPYGWRIRHVPVC
jgi:hypothetical protein